MTTNVAKSRNALKRSEDVLARAEEKSTDEVEAEGKMGKGAFWLDGRIKQNVPRLPKISTVASNERCSHRY